MAAEATALSGAEHQGLGEHLAPQLARLGAVAGGQGEGAALARGADREGRGHQEGGDEEEHDGAHRDHDPHLVGL